MEGEKVYWAMSPRQIILVRQERKNLRLPFKCISEMTLLRFSNFSVYFGTERQNVNNKYIFSKFSVNETFLKNSIHNNYNKMFLVSF